MMDLSELIRRGYFPKELPRPFNTDTLADLVASGTSLPADFSKVAKKGVKFPIATAGRYSLARGGLLRRQLSICNPLHQYSLAREVAAHWPMLLKKVSGSSLAATSPTPKKKGRAIDARYPLTERPRLSQRARIGRRYVLRTDIARFYHSLYTHAIPWALHTKPIAKKNRTFQLLGNRLDFWVRHGQDGQTVGIPIGPDTSLLIAELIMHRCDEMLSKRIPAVRGHRFIDDYELSFATRTEAEDAFHWLEYCLADYELALNPKKTEILELPLPFEATWAIELRNHPSRPTARGQASDLEGYFSRAFELHHEFRGEPVLQYAIARLRHLEVDPKNWSLFQLLLLNCVTPEPACLPYVLEQMIRRVNEGEVIEKDGLGEVLNLLVLSHAPLNHSSEVANALWACLALEVELDAAAGNLVAGCDDSAIALLALNLDANGLFGGPIDKSTWNAHMQQDSLYGEHWLLSYEANVQGWLPSIDGGDHVAADDNFGFLKAQGVSFYRPVPGPAKPVKIALPTLPVRLIVGGAGSQ